MALGRHGDMETMLHRLPASLLDYMEWAEVGMALKAEGYPLSLFDGWSRDTDPARYHQGECARKWDTFSEVQGDDGVGAGTIWEIARRHGVSLRHAAKGQAFDWGDDVEIVDPAYVEAIDVDELTAYDGKSPTEQLVSYLRALFEDTEHVCYVTQSWRGDDGKWNPKRGFWDRTAGELIAELEDGGDVAKAIGDWEPEAGAWICHNPVDGNGRTNKNVTSYRFGLLESDVDEPGVQIATAKALNLPIAAIVDSAGKSSHIIFRVDANDMDQYKERVNKVYNECQRAGMHVDGQNRNPSRLSRMPGVTRGGTLQRLIATDIGASSYEEWEDWVAEERDDLPPTTNLAETLADLPRLADPLIEDVLRKGHKMLLAGPSKAGKSFALMQLAVAVAEGGLWMGHRCAQGRVLYVNLEIDPASSAHRFKAIYEAQGLVPECAGNVDVWNLRGKACPMDRLAPRLIHRAAKKGRDPEHGGYSLIIVDPIYKVLGGCDENSAGDMGAFCNQFDKVCAELGCSVVYCHHHSKGYQGGKSSMDRMSGSGVFARDPDAILDMTALAASDPELKAARDQEVISEVLRTLDGAGIDPPKERRALPLLTWAKLRLYPDDANELTERVDEIWEGYERITAWRISFTLREFPSADHVDAWFDYPLHITDVTGVLAKCTYGGAETKSTDGSGQPKAKARTDKQAALEEAFEATSMGDESVRISDLAEYLEVSPRTVKRYVDESRAFERSNGGVRRVG